MDKQIMDFLKDVANCGDTASIDHIRNKAKAILKMDSTILTVDYLMQLHPALNRTQAESFLKYPNEHTIYYRECYGNGDLLFSRWMNIYF